MTIDQSASNQPITYKPPNSSGYGSTNCGCGPEASCSLHGSGAAQGLERTRYFPRQLVTPDDLTQDQIYHRDKLRRHNRHLHGFGIVCGLVVQRCGDGRSGGSDIGGERGDGRPV